MQTNQHLGRQIRLARRRAGMTLADAAGSRLSPAFLSKVERGRRGISAVNLRYVARRIGKDLGFFVRRADGGAAAMGELVDEAEDLTRAGRYSQAIGLLRDVIRIVPGSDVPLRARCRTALGVATLMLGRFDRARAHLEQGIRIAEASPDLGAIARARAGLGNYFYYLGAYPEAVEQYQLALTALRRQRPPDRRALSVALMNVGIALHFLHRVDEALAHLLQAARKAPPRDEVHRGMIHRALASALFETGRREEALVRLRDACQRFVRAGRRDLVSDAENGLGLWHINMGRPREAILHLERASQKWGRCVSDRQRGRSLTELARAYAMLKQFERALPVVTEAIQVTTGARDDEEVARAQVLRGEILMALGRAGEAAAAYAAAVPILERRERQRDLLDACVALGRALERDGQHARASEAYARAVDIARVIAARPR